MLKIDLHLHTIASGHAHNTILEYINQAKKLKMKIIGFTEHGPLMDNSPISEVYFSCLDRLPRTINGIKILRGIEANILNKKGKIDIADKIIENKLDYVIASFHDHTPFKDLGTKNNTQAMINCIKSGRVEIISHPFLTKDFSLNVEKIYQTACEYNVLLEINLHYITEKKLKPDTISNLKKMIDIIKKFKRKVIIGSDAHNIWEMADDTPLEKIKKTIGLTDYMIINNYPEELLKLLSLSS